MCAINGFNFEDRELVVKMNLVTAHRGPDGTGVFAEDGISLGHNRLSIIDLSTAANQPMSSNNGNLVIIFNGEIYNFRELKKELPDYQFKTKSDTEVILAAYEKWGEDCVSRLNGIFAFAIWDREKKKLFLARDQVGVKPLYYFWDGKKFIFSSEIKAVLEHKVERKLNTEAFKHYMRILYVPAPLTMFQGIYKMEPGTVGVFKAGDFRTRRYWEPKNEILNRSEDKIENELRNKIKEAVSRQLISDRPLGVYLSGGMDSSIILDCLAKERTNIDTFSVGFELGEQEEPEKFNQDFLLAGRTAKYYGTKHHELIVSSQGVMRWLHEAIWHMDEPVSNPTEIAMIALARYTKKQGVTVVLGGDGGDELFGGYERYRLDSIADMYQRVTPHALRQILDSSDKFKKLNIKPGIDRFALFMFQKDPLLSRVLKTEYASDRTREFFEKKYFSENNIRLSAEKLMEVDSKTWLVDESLMRSDKMSMASGLEVRVPLLDINLVTFAGSIPTNNKVDIWRTKKIMKSAFMGRLPKYLFDQPKRGWFSPAAKWLRHETIIKEVVDILSPDYYEPTNDIFNWPEVSSMFTLHRDKKNYNLTMIWAILTFQIWAKTFKVEI